MTAHRLLVTGAIILMLAASALAQANLSTNDGKIIEQSLFALPTYEQIPEEFRNTYSQETVDRIRNSGELELIKIKYLSDGLRI